MYILRPRYNAHHVPIYGTFSLHSYDATMIPEIIEEIYNLPPDAVGILLHVNLADALVVDMGYSYRSVNYVGTFKYPNFPDDVLVLEEHAELMKIDAENMQQVYDMDVNTRHLMFIDNGMEYPIHITRIENCAIVELPDYPDKLMICMFLGYVGELYENVAVCSYDLSSELRLVVMPCDLIISRNDSPVLKYKNLNYCISKGTIANDILDLYIGDNQSMCTTLQ